MTRTPFVFRALVAWLLFTSSARADLLSVGVGSWSDVGTATETWDRGANPSGSANITIPVLNASGSPTATLFGWALGIEIVPVGGATGTISVGTVSDSKFDQNTGADVNPVANNVFARPDQTEANTFSSPAAYTTIQGNNSLSNGVTVPASGDNLAYFNLTSTNAVGTFKIIAFNDATNGYSNWTYYNAANGTDPNNGHDFAFTNIGATGSFPGSPSQFVLGTINVQAPSAVPEPGSLVLAGIAAAGCGGYGWRRKHRVSSKPSPVTDSDVQLPA